MGNLAETLGNNYWMVIGPLVFTLALAIWIWLVVSATRRERRYTRSRGVHARGGESRRGPVRGGIIEGSPVQRNSREEAPRRDTE
ncbi:MAG TPA: hypothetical protein VGP70_19750 [Actinomadura sp.]|nr:hypothetical protein [Actinomadura sp.]